MLQNNKRRVMTAVATAAVSLGVAGPASAQTQQDGLVNVSIADNIVQVPVGIAANICDVNAAVLANLVDTGDADCTATAESVASAGPSRDGGPTTQTGLVNVAIEDNVVQVPVGVAANICDVNVAVLATLVDTDDAACTATAESIASPGRGGRGGRA